MHPRFLITVVVVLVGSRAFGQTAVTNAPALINESTSALPGESDGKSWTFGASVAAYFVSDDDDYAQPTITFDRDWLHLEARYNYEALETASTWVGWNFSMGKELALEFTPMVGIVFGDTEGVAPGYEGTLSWWKFELYSEGEYLFDTEESSDNFFYNWSELSIYPVEWFRVGMVTQRTRVYQSDREIQRGVLVGFSYKAVALSGYWLNPDDDEPIVMISLGLTF